MLGFGQKYLLEILKKSKGDKQTMLALQTYELQMLLYNPILKDLIKESVFKEVRFLSFVIYTSA